MSIRVNEKINNNRPQSKPSGQNKPEKKLYAIVTDKNGEGIEGELEHWDSIDDLTELKFKDGRHIWINGQYSIWIEKK